MTEQPENPPKEKPHVPHPGLFCSLFFIGGVFATIIVMNAAERLHFRFGTERFYVSYNEPVLSPVQAQIEKTGELGTAVSGSPEEAEQHTTPVEKLPKRGKPLGSTSTGGP